MTSTYSSKSTQFRSYSSKSSGSRDYMVKSTKAPSKSAKSNLSSKSSKGGSKPSFVFLEQNCTNTINAEDPFNPEVGDISILNCLLHEVDTQYEDSQMIGSLVGTSFTMCTVVGTEPQLLDCSYQDVLDGDPFLSPNGVSSSLRSQGLFLPDLTFPFVGGTGFFKSFSSGELILELFNDDTNVVSLFLHTYYIE
eukprot:1704177-Ditylum_brightwellii.AAC.1